jgi:mRNA-decapping enzyme 1B
MATVIDSETRRKANLRSLQRLDSNIVDLAITATHVVLYEFSNAKRTWEKKNIEGSLFVTKRSDAPRFKLIILNRSSNENLEVPITASFQMQVKDPYMIFRDGCSQDEIRGIWFHDDKERESIGSYLDQVVKSLVKIEEMEASRGAASAAAAVAVESSEAKVDTANAGAALLATLNLGAKKQAEEMANETKQPSSQDSDKNMVLDKKSLQLSLLSLIQDERFLDLIHAQYLKVVNARNAREQQQGKREGDK